MASNPPLPATQARALHSLSDVVAGEVPAKAQELPKQRAHFCRCWPCHLCARCAVCVVTRAPQAEVLCALYSSLNCCNFHCEGTILAQGVWLGKCLCLWDLACFHLVAGELFALNKTRLGGKLKLCCFT